MANTLWLTIDWQQAASDLSESQQEAVTQTLLRELQSLDDVEQVSRVADPEVPTGGMGAQWLWSILTAEITVDGLKQVVEEVYARIPGKPMSFTLAVNGQSQTVSVENVSPEKFEEVLAQLVDAAKQLGGAK